MVCLLEIVNCWGLSWMSSSAQPRLPVSEWTGTILISDLRDKRAEDKHTSLMNQLVQQCFPGRRSSVTATREQLSLCPSCCCSSSPWRWWWSSSGWGLTGALQTGLTTRISPTSGLVSTSVLQVAWNNNISRTTRYKCSNQYPGFAVCLLNSLLACCFVLSSSNKLLVLVISPLLLPAYQSHNISLSRAASSGLPASCCSS